RGVERRAVKAVEPGDRRDAGDRQLPAGGHEYVGLVSAGACVERPFAVVAVPARPGDLGVRVDPVEHAVLTSDVLEVGLDLRLGRVAARPARVRFKRELVKVRWDVAGGAGIGGVVP